MLCVCVCGGGGGGGGSGVLVAACCGDGNISLPTAQGRIASLCLQRENMWIKRIAYKETCLFFRTSLVTRQPCMLLSLKINTGHPILLVQYTVTKWPSVE